jgi:outer membrane protein OmpA-like peptidoglycan-associated protein/outer membrane protein assembly factor BamD (BamD/ComL family)
VPLQHRNISVKNIWCKAISLLTAGQAFVSILLFKFYLSLLFGEITFTLSTLNKLKLRILFILLISFWQVSNAQKHTNPHPKAVELYNEATQLEKQRQPAEAIKKLDQALKKDNTFDEAWLKKADLHKFMFQTEAAVPCWEMYLQLNPAGKESVRVHFALGDWYFKQQEYEKAEQHLSAMLSTYNKKDANFHKAETLLKSCGFIKEQTQKGIPALETRALPDVVNRFPMQYFPAITADEKFLVFTARRGYGINDDENLYLTKFVNGSWTPPQPISPTINTKGNEGTGSISADARVLVFTSCDYPDAEGSCDLYISYREGNNWSKPENLRKINSPSWESHPSLSADGKRLFFASTRPGGVGGHDIWCSEMDENDEWQKPYNLGAPINTPLDELSPFIHANGQTLFFASDGHPGIGAFDLFMSTFDGKKWSESKNLGPPINTKNSEMALYLTANGNRAFYSKEEDTEIPENTINRTPPHLKGNSKKMQNSFIYELNWPAWLKLKNPCGYVTGTVSDALTKQKIAAKIDLIDLEQDQTIYRVVSDKLYGNYTMVLATGKKYGLFVSADGYLYQSMTFDYEHSPTLEPRVINFELMPVKKGERTVMQNIFFESGKFELLPASIPELKKVIQFLNQNGDAKIEISGHTDDVGNEADNLKLSNQRANAVAEYLIKNGIEKNRIIAKGMGKSKPLVPNINEENRAQNRRIEFSVL